MLFNSLPVVPGPGASGVGVCRTYDSSLVPTTLAGGSLITPLRRCQMPDGLFKVTKQR